MTPTGTHPRPRDALRELLERSRGENLSEVMWLRRQIGDTDRRLADER